ncbi:sigma-70 family RNA polymerase sigma factor [Actinoplanes sp. NPDC049118]|uniref:sigma-70 family RNA polymerase sigma factor n=1 Tax=Actinoplanes sp. NPDC049118 TaxID=3155769 RepID=UPI003400D419
MTATVVMADLIVAAQRGDRAALDRLLGDHLPLVYNIAARTLPPADADDVTQETLIRAMAGLARLREPSSFRSWLVAIAVRETRRRGKRLGADRQHFAIADTGDLLAQDPGPGEEAVHRLEVGRQRRTLAAATGWLEAHDRELLGLWWLVQVGAMSGEELAPALGISASHARVRLQRLRARVETARHLIEALEARPGCADLRELIRTWDGRPAPVWRKRLARHVQDCHRCTAARVELLPPERLLVALPLLVPPPHLRDLADVVERSSAAASAALRTKLMKGAAVVAAVLVTVLGVGAVIIDRSPEPEVVVTAPRITASGPSDAASPAPPPAPPPAPAKAVPIGAGAGFGGPAWSARQRPPTQGGRYLYVSGKGNDSNNGLSRAEALRSLRRAAELTRPGDTVLVDNGEYSEPRRSAVVTIERSGTPRKWITWAAYPGARPVVRASQWQGIWVHASYITVSGFTVTGGRTSLTRAQIAAAQRGDVSDPAVSTSCIAVTELRGADPPRRPHHVVLWGNSLTDCTLAGISVQYADYVTAAYNVTERNGWYSPYGGSGISFSSLWNSDSRTDTKMVIRGNVTAENQNRVPCLCSGAARKVTDGNGIIVESLDNDDSRGAPLFQQPYAGRTLVENNVAYRNGGRGINVFRGAHVDVVNNTLYRNAAHPAIDIDLAVTRAQDVRVVNNIVVPGTGSPAAVVSESSEVRFDHNLLAGRSDIPRDRAVLRAAPRFADAAAGDFRLAAGSSAIDSGAAGLAPKADADRLRRQSPVDRGAFERR